MFFSQKKRELCAPDEGSEGGGSEAHVAFDAEEADKEGGDALHQSKVVELPAVFGVHLLQARRGHAVRMLPELAAACRRRRRLLLAARRPPLATLQSVPENADMLFQSSAKTLCRTCRMAGFPQIAASKKLVLRSIFFKQ